MKASDYVGVLEFTNACVPVASEPVEPFVDDEGIYIPSSYDQRYYQCLITRELFVEAYNKWIKGADPKRNFINHGKDTADDWSE